MSDQNNLHKMSEYDRLIEKIHKNNLNIDLEKLELAYKIADEAHQHQYRSSGELYITHPIAVAEILVDLRLSDTESVITALLHDTVEDCNITLERIKELFGDTIAQLVSGVTKLRKIEYKNQSSAQVENFRKLFMAISEDVRTLLIKLADRLHNMRTICYIEDLNKRKQKALETMEIYAPLAERIGVHKLKNELQDLSFTELYPEARNAILHRISFLRPNGLSLVKMIEQQIRQNLMDAGIDATIHGREKTCFAIWKKMERKKINFEQLSDIIAFRILVENVEDCYRTLGVIHINYHCIFEHFKDYISIPKSNQYQSIHTLVLGPNNRSIEIQIRTHKMHQIAEFGVAAHWAYKQSVQHNIDSNQFQWIRELLSTLENSSNSEEFMQNTKIDMSYDQVFCFTPKGDLIALPIGSNPIDFAFAIHSDLGLKCVGAKINGAVNKLDTILDNGDQVEIISGKEVVIDASWIKSVHTGKAKAEIKRFLKNKNDRFYQNFGEMLYAKIMKNHQIPQHHQKQAFLLKNFFNHSIDDLYFALGTGEISDADLMNFYYQSTMNQHTKNTDEELSIMGEQDIENHKQLIKGFVNDDQILLAKCCNPIPGDKILVVAGLSNVLEIHTIDCPSLTLQENLIWSEAEWDKTQNLHYQTLIRMIINCDTCILLDALNILTEYNSSIKQICKSLEHEHLLIIVCEVEVKGIHQLIKLFDCLRELKGVHIERHKDIVDNKEGTIDLPLI